MKKFWLLLLFISIYFTALSQTTGPEKGSLVIVGGGRVGPEIVNKFIELAGGPNAKIVVIPTAAGRAKYDESNSSYQLFKKGGATNLTLLHTDDPNVANTAKFTAPLKNAHAVWFGGGRQWRLVDSYADTEAEELFWKVLDRGGVIGGSSAGATIQGSYLARGDTDNNQVMMGDHEEGFGFVKNIAIDQHVLARNRQFDLFEITRAKPELLGIGIDESTAVVVKKNKFEVIGQSYVLIYDNSFWSREGSDLKKLPAKEHTFYMLRSGDQYDMLKRKVIE